MVSIHCAEPDEKAVAEVTFRIPSGTPFGLHSDARTRLATGAVAGAGGLYAIIWNGGEPKLDTASGQGTTT